MNITQENENTKLLVAKSTSKNGGYLGPTPMDGRFTKPE